MSFTTNYQVTNDLHAWQKSHENNAKQTNEILSNSNLDQEEVMAQYFSNQEKIGTQFDFMQGKDATNSEEYQEALDILGKGEVQSMDLNRDGAITIEEYLANELDGVEDNLKQDTATVAYLMFNVIDQAMGNGDKQITADEFARFYKNMDSFKLDENGEYNLSQDFDGKIDIDSANEYTNWIIDNIFDESTIQATSDLLNKIPEYTDRLSTIQGKYKDYIEEQIKASANN